MISPVTEENIFNKLLFEILKNGPKSSTYCKLKQITMQDRGKIANKKTEPADKITLQSISW